MPQASMRKNDMNTITQLDNKVNARSGPLPR